MKVLKFGGACLAEEGGIEAAGRLVSQAHRRGGCVVVLSALQGVVPELLAAVAEAGSFDYGEALSRLREQHLQIIQRLFPPQEQARVVTPLQIMLNDLEDILHGVQLIRECSGRSRDLILSFGARLACLLFYPYLKALGLPAEMAETRELIQTNSDRGSMVVDFQISYERIRRGLGPAGNLAVIAGGVASTAGGVVTTLGRDGEDYTASLVGAALEAEQIEIWTAVDGVMSADPALVPQAFMISELSYQEAMELSYFGARVLHSRAMIPAMESRIPIRIANLRRADQSGTLISIRAAHRGRPVTGIASIDEVALINIEGGGMIGIPGIAARVFGVLARASINIMMISQASSEHSICLVFRRSEAARGLEALERELSLEIAAKRIQELTLKEDVAILAIIGENMQGTPGISGKLFGSLGQAGINVLAIAQGSSERNISVVIEKKDQQQALATVHQAFLEE